MEFYYIKALHIIFVITWFAGLFYLPRLMVYAAEANQLSNETARGILLNQYQIMKKRLLYAIIWPSAIITLILGGRLLMLYPLTGWLKVKLIFVIFLYFYHVSLHILFKQQQKGIFKYSGQQLRVWNEVPTILLFSIVFLVVLKSTINFLWGIAALFALMIVLMLAIRIYKLVRNKKA